VTRYSNWQGAMAGAPVAAAKKTKAPDHTPCQAKGEILPGSSDELLTLAKDASAAGEHVKAVHFYTMALDMLAKGLSRDTKGRASDADLQSLNKSSGGQLAELLSGRSHCYLRQKDLEAAIEDAETCARADPSSEKGQLRLLVALEAAGVDLRTQLEACENAVEACPGSEPLVARKWRLKKAIAESAANGYNKPNDQSGNEAWTIADTRRLADDVSNPRRPLAAVDLGRSYASGAHGLEKDLQQAARYLRLGCQAGDVSAQRDLGLVLLDLGQPAEAAEELRQAADAGDEEARAVLQQLGAEAQSKEAEARAKLKELAELGDPRAAQILKELSA